MYNDLLQYSKWASCIMLDYTHHRASFCDHSSLCFAVFKTQCGYDLLAVALDKWGTTKSGSGVMALGVDKALSDTSSQMESKSYGCWKTRTPEFFRRGHSKPLSQRVIERTRPANVLGTKDSDTERSGCKKTVTMAPVSRYMTDRSLYTMRKPLTSAQCQIPILKNSSTYEDSEMVRI